MDLQTILTSGAVATVVSAVFSFISSERKIKVENVIRERALWRETIRNLCTDVCHECLCNQNITYRSAHLRKLRVKFQIRLNPDPKEDEDEAILKSIDRLINAKDDQALKNGLEEFSKRVAFLLKYDWERAKYEAAAWPFRYRQNGYVEYKPIRWPFRYIFRRKYFCKCSILCREEPKHMPYQQPTNETD
jgi:hypothetical protein